MASISQKNLTTNKNKNKNKKIKRYKNMKKTIAQQLNVTNFPFIINDSNGNKIYEEFYSGFWCKWEYDSNGNIIYQEGKSGFWIKYEYDSNGNEIYSERANGFWYKYEYDSEGNEIYFENSCGTIRDNRNVTEEIPEESLLRLIKDKVVLEFCQDFGCASSEATMEIVLNISIMTSEYYSELMEVINKLQDSTKYIVTIKYGYKY